MEEYLYDKGGRLPLFKKMLHYLGKNLKMNMVLFSHVSGMFWHTRNTLLKLYHVRRKPLGWRVGTGGNSRWKY